MFKLSKSNHINFAWIFKKRRNIFSEIPAVKNRRRRQRINNFLKYSSLILAVLCLLIFIFFSGHFINLKFIYQSYLSGQKNLSAAALLLKNGDYKKASALARFAENNFSSSLEMAEKYADNYFIKQTDFFSGEWGDIVYLLGAGELLSRATGKAAEYEVALAVIAHDPGIFNNTEAGKNILSKIYQAEPELHGIRANLELARMKLGSIKFTGVLWPLREKINDLSEHLSTIRNRIDKISASSRIVPALLGYPDKASYLVVFEDTGELWPSGGRIRAFGVLDVSGGDIANFDVYDAARFSALTAGTEPVEAPETLAKHKDISDWTIKDANWLPDWPDVSAQIINFISGSSGFKEYKWSGVIAVTPEAINDLLSLNGPITINNRKYDQNNFIKLLRSEDDKKDIGALIIGLKNFLPLKSLADIASLHAAIIDNLDRKNILFNFQNKELQKMVEDNNWAGSGQRDISSDYLRVIDTNTSGVDDGDVNRSLEYKFEESLGGLFSSLYLNYSYSGKGGEYKNFVRIFVPGGSQILEYSGFEENSVIIEQESDLSRSSQSDITSISGVFRVQPGEIKQLRLYYKLPSGLLEGDHYSLYVQKQPGNKVGQLVVDFNALNKVKSYKPIGYNVYRENDNNVGWQSDFDTDKIFFIGL